MPPKDDDDPKSTKEVVTKKQKQMLNREELDLSLIAEVFGGVIMEATVTSGETNPITGERILQTIFGRQNPPIKKRGGSGSVPVTRGRGGSGSERVTVGQGGQLPKVDRPPGVAAAAQAQQDVAIGAKKSELDDFLRYLTKGNIKIKPTANPFLQLDLPGMTPKPPKSSPNILKGLKTVGKTPVGKFASKVAPGAGLAIGTVDAANRIRKGDYGGAALSGLGAAASTVLPPGPGTLAALGIAGVQAATDTVGLTGDRSIKPPKPARPVILPGGEPGQKPKTEPQTQPQPDEPGGKRKPSAPTIVQPGSKPQIQTPGQNVNAKPNVLPMPIPVSTPTKRGTDTKTPRPRGRRPFGFLGFPDQPGGVIGRRQNPQ